VATASLSPDHAVLATRGTRGPCSAHPDGHTDPTETPTAVPTLIAMTARLNRLRRTGHAAALLPLLAASAAAQPREPFTGLDAYVTKALADWKVPGLGLAIVRNDSVLYVKGYGVRSTATRQPVDERTLFAIGSTSKAFTTAALAMLADSGRLAFDAPV